MRMNGLRCRSPTMTMRRMRHQSSALGSTHRRTGGPCEHSARCQMWRESNPRTVNQLKEFLYQTGFDYDSLREDDFQDYVQMLIRETYTIDQIATERQYNRAGEVCAFWLLDGATISRTTDAGAFARGVRFVQRVQDQIIEEYKDNLIFDYKYKRADFRYRGYGYSPIEMATDVITTLLFGYRYIQDQLVRGRVHKRIHTLELPRFGGQVWACVFRDTPVLRLILHRRSVFKAESRRREPCPPSMDSEPPGSASSGVRIPLKPDLLSSGCRRPLSGLSTRARRRSPRDQPHGRLWVTPAALRTDSFTPDLDSMAGLELCCCGADGVRGLPSRSHPSTSTHTGQVSCTATPSDDAECCTIPR